MSDDTVELNQGDERPRRSDSDNPVELPGKLLAAKRQELNWSVEDVAHSLHMAPRQIQAIEADNYGALPGMAIARGFIRSYAKLLKVDPVPFLQMIPSEADARSDEVSLRRALPAKPFYPDKALNLGTSSPRSWIRVLVLLVVVLLTVGLLAWKAGWLPSELMAEAERLVPASASSEAEGEHQTSGAIAPPASVEASPDVSADVSKGQSGSAEKISASVSQTSTGSDTQSAPVPVQQANNSAGKDVLVLKLREDSWIEIRNEANKVLLARLAKAGESEAIAVNEPIKLVIGNASGVDAKLRGVPVELNAAAKSNMARLTVK